MNRFYAPFAVTAIEASEDEVRRQAMRSIQQLTAQILEIQELFLPELLSSDVMFNGQTRLGTLETVIGFAQSLACKGKQPPVNLVNQTDHTGVKLTQKAMAELEKKLRRLQGLEKGFVAIVPLLA